MEKIDTYSIMPGRMQFSLNTGSVLPKDYPQNYEVPCNHYLGVHTFLNLHNNIPIETRPFNNIAGEIPYITPWLLPDDIPAQAIIHALPICRVVNDVFIPSYTQFIISYFSLAPRLILDTHYANERKISEEDSEYYPRTVLLPHSYPNTLSDRIIKILQRDGVLPLENQQDPFDGYVHNLSLWARNGNLGYLDYSQKTLDLKIGVNLALPNLYLDIKGKGYAYSWNNNKIQPL
ncbi:MAG: hypothetical protein ABI947_22245 [Chloroflexota bacterium]